MDIPAPTSHDARPTMSFRGDALVVLDQRVVNDSLSESIVRFLVVDEDACDSVKLESGARIASGEQGPTGTSAHHAVPDDVVHIQLVTVDTPHDIALDVPDPEPCRQAKASDDVPPGIQDPPPDRLLVPVAPL